MDKLEILSLDFTGISSLPPSVGNLKNLKSLSLDSNCLSNLPGTLGFCQNLCSLSLKNNAFTCVPKVILMLTNLKNLSIIGNPFIIFEGKNQRTYSKQLGSSSHSPALLQVKCSASAFLFCIDHNLDPVQNKTIDYHASNQIHCERCSMLIREGKPTSLASWSQCFVSLISLI